MCKITVSDIEKWDKEHPVTDLPENIVVRTEEEWSNEELDSFGKSVEDVSNGVFFNISKGTRARFFTGDTDSINFSRRGAISFYDLPCSVLICENSLNSCLGEYVEELDAIKISFLYIDPRLEKTGELWEAEKKEVLEYSRYYITRSKDIYEVAVSIKKISSAYYSSAVSIIVPGTIIKSSNESLASKLGAHWTEGAQQLSTKNGDTIISAFTVMFGNYYFSGRASEIREFKTKSDVVKFLQQNEINSTNKLKQKAVDVFLGKYNIPELSGAPEDVRNVAKIYRLDSGLCIIVGYRLFQKEYIQCQRIYVCGHDVYWCGINNLHEWVYRPPLRINWDFYLMDYRYKDICGSYLEYLNEDLEPYSRSDKGIILGACIAIPWMRKIIETPLCSAIEVILKKDRITNLSTSVSLYFGGIDKSANNVRAITGLNRHQIKSIGKMYTRIWNDLDDNEEPSFAELYLIKYMKIPFMKYCSKFIEEDPFYAKDKDYRGINFVDDKTFDFVAKEIFLACHFPGMCDPKDLAWALYLCSKNYGWKSTMSAMYDYSSTGTFKCECEKIYNDTKTTDTVSTSWINLFLDLQKNIAELKYSFNVTKYFKPNIKTASELIEIHDESAIFVNSCSIGRKSEPFSFNKDYYCHEISLNELDKYQYNDAKYSADIIGETAYILREGKKLHNGLQHNFLPFVSGKYYAVSIRLKSMPTEPCYIVVIKDMQIIDVRGFKNFEPYDGMDVTEFIKRWAKKKGLKYFYCIGKQKWSFTVNPLGT